MTARIITYHGQTDGLRFGRVQIGDMPRAFRWDRLADRVFLYLGWCETGRELDADPDRNAAALEALRRVEPITGRAA